MRIVLAYGASLSSSAAIPWLRAAHHAEIIAVTLDLGQGRELEAMRDRALMLGAQRAHVLDARESFARDLVVPALRADALHGGRVPAALALSRPAIARALVEIAAIEGADAIAHASDAGVDSCLHRLLAARAPSMPLLAPAHEWSMTSSDLEAPGRAHGLATDSAASRVDANLWGRSLRRATTRPDPTLAPRAPGACPDEPAFVDIAFAGGAPTALNGVPLPLLELVASLGTLAATHGVGYVSTDGLECFAPAAVLLHAAHRALVEAAAPADMERFAAEARAAYLAVVERGLWFSPLREGLDAFFTASQARVNGHVRLRLRKGEHATIATELSLTVPEVTAPGDSTLSSTTLMTTLWSGRFDQAPDAAAFEWGSSFSFDCRLFEDDVTGSLAWARALAGAGVLTADEAHAIQAALADILARGLADPAFVSGDDEDVHSFVERLLVAKLGDTGKRLHTGRSRNEQVSLDLRLYLRRRIPHLQHALAAIVSALTRQARSAGDALMPSYTHFRPAQPVLVAHFLLAHAAPLRRDFDRLTLARQEAGALTLGSGAIAGTSYAVDVQRIAHDLGFDRVVSNSIDASSDRDFAATFLYASAMAMVHLSRLAEDLIILCGDEHRFFEFSDALSTGSSMMPQKKNPDPLELVRGKTGRAIGDLMALLTTMKGIPSGYNKDLQEDKHAVFDAEDTLAGCTAVVKSVIEGLTLNRVRAGAAASGLLLATDVADYLVGKGVPFRSAHEIVGALVRRLVAEQREFASLSLDEWRAASDHFDADVVDRVTPAASVAAKCTPQSTAPAAVARALAETEAWAVRVSARSHDAGR